jgi:hypothetical protein
MIMVLPVSRAGAIFPNERIRGKFHGMIPREKKFSIYIFYLSFKHTSTDTKGSVLGVNRLLVILELLFWDIEGA